VALFVVLGIEIAADIFRRLANSIFHCKYPCLLATCLQNSEGMWLLELKTCSTVKEQAHFTLLT
jgi:hypothetical protein